MGAKQKKGKKFWAIIGAAAGAVVLVAGAFLLWWMLSGSRSVVLDFGPAAVEMSINRSGKVTQVQGVDEGGKQLVDGYQMLDDDLHFVLGDVLERYLQGIDPDDEVAEDLLMTMSEGFSEAEVAGMNELLVDNLDYYEAYAYPWQQSIKIDGELRKTAEAAGISVGHMALVERLAATGSAERDALLGMTVSGLIAYADENELDTGLVDLYLWYFESAFGDLGEGFDISFGEWEWEEDESWVEEDESWAEDDSWIEDDSWAEDDEGWAEADDSWTEEDENWVEGEDWGEDEDWPDESGDWVDAEFEDGGGDE